MEFKFSETSLKRLNGVHPSLTLVLNKALEMSKVDFGIASGVRTAEEQNKKYRKGLSELDGYKRKSKHQIQEDGYGHAVDIYIWDKENKKGVFDYTKENGWMWLEVGRAILRASRLLDVPITWGLTFNIGSGYDVGHFELKE